MSRFGGYPTGDISVNVLVEERVKKEDSGMSRFDYVKYDEEAMQQQANFKVAFENIEHMACSLDASRWRSELMTQLEYAYMCAGKMIRDDQIMRNGTAELEESRGDS